MAARPRRRTRPCAIATQTTPARLPRPPRLLPAAGEDGYFPPSSILRRVHEERVVGLLYGQRALGIGALSPLNYVGTSLHTRARDQPFKRLVRTAKMFETIYFGSRREADEVLQTVDFLHEKVHGALPPPAGPFPAGTPYSAMDPELMLWMVAVIADSAQVLYELFVRRLSDAERDALWREYVRFAELFGMPRDAAPGSYREFRAWWNQRLASEQAFLTPEARYVGFAIMFQIPVPVTHVPAMSAHNLLILGSLPRRVRELYGLRFTPARETAFRALVPAVRAQRRLAPRRLRTGWNTPFFDLVARTEQARLERGELIPGSLVH